MKKKIQIGTIFVIFLYENLKNMKSHPTKKKKDQIIFFFKNMNLIIPLQESISISCKMMKSKNFIYAMLEFLFIYPKQQYKFCFITKGKL